MTPIFSNFQGFRDFGDTRAVQRLFRTSTTHVCEPGEGVGKCNSEYLVEILVYTTFQENMKIKCPGAEIRICNYSVSVRTDSKLGERSLKNTKRSVLD